MPVRQREEIQKMLRGLTLNRAQRSALVLNRAQRSAAQAFHTGFVLAARCALVLNRAQRSALGLLLLAALPLGAAILPDQIGDFARGETKALAAQDPALYQEFGFVAGEQAQYTNAQKRFILSAWRLQDSTGALALFEERRPADSTRAKLSALSARARSGAVLAYGNYVFEISGDVPEQNDLDLFFSRLPQFSQAPLPALAAYLPQDGLIPNSERYILGPAALARYEPRIAPSLAAFHLSAEGQLGRYKTPKGDLTLIIFNYPTPGMARDRQAEFLKMPGTLAKRSGPIVAVVVHPADPDAAESLLSRVQYAGNLTSNESVPVNEGLFLYRLFLNIFVLSGALIGLSIILGIGFGGFRILRRKLGKHEHDDPFQLLRIGDK